MHTRRRNSKAPLQENKIETTTKKGTTNMKENTTNHPWLKGSLAYALALLTLVIGCATSQPPATAADKNDIIAIDILLQPDATMLEHAAAINDLLRKDYPKGFALDASHRPHVTMAQRYVRTADLDKVYAAVGKVLASANVTGLKLEAYKYYYIPDGPVGLQGIVVKPTPELLKVQQAVIDAVTPFAVKNGTAAAFVPPTDGMVIVPALIEYVEVFVPNHSGEHYMPHVTTGIASREYLDKMAAGPLTRSPSHRSARPFTISATTGRRRRNSMSSSCSPERTAGERIATSNDRCQRLG